MKSTNCPVSNTNSDDNNAMMESIITRYKQHYSNSNVDLDPCGIDWQYCIWQADEALRLSEICNLDEKQKIRAVVKAFLKAGNFDIDQVLSRLSFDSKLFSDDSSFWFESKAHLTMERDGFTKRMIGTLYDPIYFGKTHKLSTKVQMENGHDVIFIITATLRREY
jgi:hypothetical protein